MGTEWTWNRGALRMFYNSDMSDYGTPSGANNNGNLYRVDTFVPTTDNATQWAMSIDYYGYDHLNRITGIWENKAAHNLGETGTGLTQQYTFDRYGNRTVNNPVSTFPVENSPYTVTTASNRLQKTGNCMIYDLAGNLTDDCGRTRAYDGNNKMISAYDVGIATSYRYNADGQRVIKTVGTVSTWYIYGMGGELIAEYPANGATNMPQMEYGYRGGELLIEGGCDVVRWKVSDHLGSTRMSIGTTGTLASVKRTDYLPFGEEIGATVGIRTALQGYSQVDCWKQKFTGYEKDTETGLDYAQARYYSNVQGRFTSPDPLLSSGKIGTPQSWNRYSYSYNNPLKYTDPSGFDPDDEKEKKASFSDRFKRAVRQILNAFGLPKTPEDPDVTDEDVTGANNTGNPNVSVNGAVAGNIATLAHAGEYLHSMAKIADPSGGIIVTAAGAAGGIDSGGELAVVLITGPIFELLPGTQAGTNALKELAIFRSELGLPAVGIKFLNKEVVLSKLEIGGSTFFGISGHGQNVTLKVNAVTAKHAEGDAFQQAFNAGARSDVARLVVDKALCGFCGANGGVKSMARQLGVQKLEVVTPKGTKIMKIN